MFYMEQITNLIRAVFFRNQIDTPAINEDFDQYDEETGSKDEVSIARKDQGRFFSLPWWIAVPGSFLLLGTFFTLLGMKLSQSNSSKKMRSQPVSRDLMNVDQSTLFFESSEYIWPTTPAGVALYPSLSAPETQGFPMVATKKVGSSVMIGTVFVMKPAGTVKVGCQIWNLTTSISDTPVANTDIIELGNSALYYKTPVDIISIPGTSRFFVAYLNGGVRGVQITYDGDIYLNDFGISAAGGGLTQVSLMQNIFNSVPVIDVLSLSDPGGCMSLLLARISVVDNQQLLKKTLLNCGYGLTIASQSGYDRGNFTILTEETSTCGQKTQIVSRIYASKELTLQGDLQCLTNQDQIMYGSASVTAVDEININVFSGPNAENFNAPALFIQPLSTITGKKIGAPVAVTPTTLTNRDPSWFPNAIERIPKSNSFVVVFIATEVGKTDYNTYIQYLTLSSANTINFEGSPEKVDSALSENEFHLAIASLADGVVTVEYKRTDGGLYYRDYATASFIPTITGDSLDATRGKEIQIDSERFSANSKSQPNSELVFDMACDQGAYFVKKVGSTRNITSSFAQASVDQGEMYFGVPADVWLEGPQCTMTVTDPKGLQSGTVSVKMSFNRNCPIPDVKIPGLSARVGETTTFCDQEGWINCGDASEFPYLSEVTEFLGGIIPNWAAFNFSGCSELDVPSNYQTGVQYYKVNVTNLCGTGEGSFGVTFEPQPSDLSPGVSHDVTGDVLKITGMTISTFFGVVSFGGAIVGLFYRKFRDEITENNDRNDVDRELNDFYKALGRPYRYRKFTSPDGKAFKLFYDALKKTVGFKGKGDPKGLAKAALKYQSSHRKPVGISRADWVWWSLIWHSTWYIKPENHESAVQKIAAIYKKKSSTLLLLEQIGGKDEEYLESSRGSSFDEFGVEMETVYSGSQNGDGLPYFPLGDDPEKPMPSVVPVPQAPSEGALSSGSSDGQSPEKQNLLDNPAEGYQPPSHIRRFSR